MTKKDSSPKNPTKKDLLEMAQKLQKKATEDAEKIAEMEAEKAKILSEKENTDEEKEILAIEAEYNLKIEEKKYELDKLLKEKEKTEGNKEIDSPEVNTEPEDLIEAAKKRVIDSINEKVDEEKRKNQVEIDKLSQSIKNDLTPDKPDLNQNKNDFQIEWDKKNTGENNGVFEIEINGKKIKIHIDEEKEEWKKSSKFVRFTTFGIIKGKWINATNPKWCVYTSGNNETAENKYPDEYKFNTKEEAIEKFNEIAKECQKIKFEEEKKYMGPGAQQTPTPPTPSSQQNQNNPGPKTPEPVQNISQEQLLNNLDNLEKLMEKKLDSSKFRGKILKALDKWENLGKGEGKANFIKRMIKNAINLALVGVVSSFAVDQIANAGIEIAGQTLSNTALAGGTSHYLINKIGVGLGVSAAMDRMGNKVPSKVRKWMPYVMGGGSVLAASLLSGGTVAIAAGVGVVASKLLVNGYTNEKIESREKKAREELLEKIKKGGPEINPEKVKAFEEEYTKLLKKYENQRIWGKMGATLARFGLASVISTMTLEASGYAKDIHAENQAGIKDTVAGMKSSEDQDNTSQNDSIQEKQNDEIKSDSTETKTPVSDTTSTNKESDTTNSQNEDAKTQTDSTTEEDKSGESNQDQNEFKEIKTKFSSKGAIETIKELQKKIDTDYPKDVPAHLDEFAKADPTQMAIKLGLYNPEDTTGSESAMLIKGSTLGFDENGNLSIHDIKTGEDHILIEEKGSDDAIGKYEGKMFDSDHSSENIENNSEVVGQVEENTDLSTNENLPRLEVDPETGLLIETNDGANSTDTNQNASGDENTINKEVSVTPETKLSPDMLEQVERISEYNLDRVFPNDEAINQWYNIKTINASTITQISGDKVSEIYKPLVEYVHNLQKITGITDPREATMIKPAESISEYIERALEKAASDPKIGLDKVTL